MNWDSVNGIVFSWMIIGNNNNHPDWLYKAFCPIEFAAANSLLPRQARHFACVLMLKISLRLFSHQKPQGKCRIRKCPGVLFPQNSNWILRNKHRGEKFGESNKFRWGNSSLLLRICFYNRLHAYPIALLDTYEVFSIRNFAQITIKLIHAGHSMLVYTLTCNI